MVAVVELVVGVGCVDDEAASVHPAAMTATSTARAGVVSRGRMPRSFPPPVRLLASRHPAPASPLTGDAEATT
jgi:hypothetical protein